ncbi:MAG: murein transglycosylase [Porticoccaceae bacterium]|nr:MAG: murein transglycosylase [Porticoccaceae bacterium]
MTGRRRLGALLGAALLAAQAVAAGYADHPAARAFAKRLAACCGFSEEEVRATLARARPSPAVLEAMARPAERTLNWAEYRRIFLGERRIDEGAAFWRRHRRVLAEVSARYGVDPAVVVAILGVETFYGRNTGRHRVLDALATLAFDYPPRSPFFRRELEAFLLLAREEGLDPTEPRGSYAGAMGLAQFMPSSYRVYAVDQDGDGHRDLWRNPADAAASVAAYLAGHGWRAGEPVAVRVAAPVREPALPFNRLERPRLTLEQLAASGMPLPEGLAAEMAAMPLRLEGEEGVEYWLGFANFYAITRYNHSHLYAMAVHQLSEEIRRRVG